jgi:hypothetical protein
VHIQREAWLLVLKVYMVWQIACCLIWVNLETLNSGDQVVAPSPLNQVRLYLGQVGYLAHKFIQLRRKVIQHPDCLGLTLRVSELKIEIELQE